MGATAEGRNELSAVIDGVRESKQSWQELLLDLNQRVSRSCRNSPSAMEPSASGPSSARSIRRRGSSGAGCTRPPTSSTRCPRPCGDEAPGPCSPDRPSRSSTLATSPGRHRTPPHPTTSGLTPGSPRSTGFQTVAVHGVSEALAEAGTMLHEIATIKSGDIVLLAESSEGVIGSVCRRPEIGGDCRRRQRGQDHPLAADYVEPLRSPSGVDGHVHDIASGVLEGDVRRPAGRHG